MSYLELLRKWERERREKHCLNPNLIWFHRHKDNPNVIAEVSFWNFSFRWRIFDERSYFEPRAEGNGSTLAEAKQLVLRSELWLNQATKQ